MTQEEKAMAYDKAIEKAKKMFSEKEVNFLFHELKESEDEKIRKEIIDFLELPHPQLVGRRDHEKWIAWLEKQREQKVTWSEEDERMYRELHNLIYSTPYYDSRKELSDWLKSIKDRVHIKYSIPCQNN